MKSITQKRNEAYERAQARAKLSTEQKLEIAIRRHRAHESSLGSAWPKEVKRLQSQLIEETNQAKLNGKVIIPSSKCEARKR